MMRQGDVGIHHDFEDVVEDPNWTDPGEEAMSAVLPNEFKGTGKNERMQEIGRRARGLSGLATLATANTEWQKEPSL